MAEEETLQQSLIERQNGDGGWSYHQGSSWTEPTALALLALAATGSARDIRAAGQEWLLGQQRRDGGWSPHPAVSHSTWVTSLALLALDRDATPAETQRRGVKWLLSEILPEDSPFERFFARWRGLVPDTRPAGGSPWFPGTAAWLAPTALSSLALVHVASGCHAAYEPPEIQAHIAQSQRFILSRRCRDGGWNHGGARYRSQNAGSYPETTGLALLALRDAPRALLEVPLARAIAFVRSPTSSEALSWLQLGLAAHGRDCRSASAQGLPCRGVRDSALRLLALSGPSQHHPFLPV